MNMYWDRFDICLAWHEYLSGWHRGQWSDEYRRLCRLRKFYSPGCEKIEDNENALAIYHDIVRRSEG